MHLITILQLLTAATAMRTTSQTGEKNKVTWRDSWHVDLTDDEFSIHILPRWAGDNDYPPKDRKGAELNIYTQRPTSLGHSLQTFALPCRKKHHASADELSTFQARIPSFNDPGPIPPSNTTIYVAPGHACSSKKNLANKNFDGLWVHWGSIFIDVPTELKKVGRKEEEEEGKCKGHPSGKKARGLVCWLPRVPPV